MRDKRVLLVQYSSTANGSALSGLLLADGLRESGWEVHVAFGYSGPMEDRYKEAGHTTYVLEHKNWLRRSHPIRFFRDTLDEWKKAPLFSKLIETINPAVVYINTAVSLAGAVAARRGNIPCIWHLRELFNDVGGEMYAPTLAKPLVRFIFQHYSNRLATNSQAVSDNLLGRSLSPHAKIIYNAVSDSFFENTLTQRDAKIRLGIAPDRTLIGVPGTLRPVKGQAFFLRSIANLVRDNPNTKIAITGAQGNDYSAKLMEIVDTLDIKESVEFTGVISNMPDFYRACDLVCIPSRAESFGRVVIEAFASGTPVVATAVGGIREIVDDHVNGMLVQYGDSEHLEKSIKELLNDEVLRDQIAIEALRCANEKYREKIYKQRVRQFVSELVVRSAR